MRSLTVLVVLFLSSCSSVLHAKSTNGSIAGRVTDPSKAVIADAKVAAISEGTDARYEGATNDSGEYYLTNLPPGSYRSEIEKTAFKKLIKPDLILHVQGALELNIEMTLGSASESITVEAGAPNYFTVDGVSSNFDVTGYLAPVQAASGALPALSALGGTNTHSPDEVSDFAGYRWTAAIDRK